MDAKDIPQHHVVQSPNAPLPNSYDKGDTDKPLLEVTIGDHFDSVVAKFPDHEVLVSRHQGIRYTYHQLQLKATQLASAMLKSGLQKGDRVGIWSHNNAEGLLVQVATAKIGVVLVNINPAYRVAEVEYAVNKVGCKAIIVMPSFKSSNYVGMLQELAPELPKCHPGMLAISRMPSLRRIVWIDVAGRVTTSPACSASPTGSPPATNSTRRCRPCSRR